MYIIDGESQSDAYWSSLIIFSKYAAHQGNIPVKDQKIKRVAMTAW